MIESTVEKLIMLLKMIPIEPQSITVKEIAYRMGMDASNRSDLRFIQRSLLMLHDMFPELLTNNSFEEDQVSKPYQWYYKQKAPIMQFPGMDYQTAFTFVLVDKFLNNLVPETIQDQLRPNMDYAARILKQHKTIQRWTDKIAVIPFGFRMNTPTVGKNVIHMVYQALLMDQCFSALYRKRGDSEYSRLLVHPLGLVYRQPVMYLVGHLGDAEKIKQLVLHRMKDAAVEDCPCIPVKGFRLDTYISEGNFSYLLGGKIDLVVRVHKEIADYFYEAGIGEEQLIEAEGDADRIVVRTKIHDSIELRRWLLGLGGKIQVIEPVVIREWVIEQVDLLSQTY